MLLVRSNCRSKVETLPGVPDVENGLLGAETSAPENIIRLLDTVTSKDSIMGVQGR